MFVCEGCSGGSTGGHREPDQISHPQVHNESKLHYSRRQVSQEYATVLFYNCPCLYVPITLQ